jgi:PIN domain nuclease of toxin-antitoxin system
MIYLDTHVVIWLYARRGKGLSDRACQLIECAINVFISPIVLLELDYLNEIGRTTIGSTSIFGYLEDKIGLKICDKPFLQVINFACKQAWTKDPFDRIITAQASIDQNTLITKDYGILKHYHQAVWQ